ncbi:myelin transcription factor 1-like protein [Stylophora pistillata]|uniref:myelin transcription factor 1-like protein n=1 Tax=Stylophora pistillata TaxID=50429 RepID=UPI000C04F97D|nr:myelin transcription factor 1-like protein [Stylophora pistillata]
MDEAITNALDGAEDDDVWQEDDDCNPFNNEDGDDDLYYAEELDREAAEIDEDEYDRLFGENGTEDDDVWQEDDDCDPFNDEDGGDDLYYAEELDREAAEIDEDEYDRLFGESDNEEFDGF